MKGYSSSAAPPPSKRRWKGQAITVLALVFFSLLVPLAFLLGLHNRFPSGYFNDERSTSETVLRNFEREDGHHDPSQVDQQSKVDHLVRKFGPGLSEDVGDKQTVEVKRDLHVEIDSEPKSAGVTATPKQKVQPSAQTHTTLQEPIPSSNIRNSGEDGKTSLDGLSTVDEAKKSCQLEFGSYCIWSKQHKEVMKDSLVKKLKDQLFLARAYYPSIAKLKDQEQLSRDLKLSIQEHERILSEAISDGDLPQGIQKRIEKMDQIIAKTEVCHVQCSNIHKKLRQLLDLTEDEAHFHMKQSAFLYQLGVQTIPKSLHCLSMRLTVENFRSQPVDTDSNSHKFHSPTFRHYVIFSKNILSSSVAINSTVMNSKETANMVFHLLTDAENYYAMKQWFARNSYGKATIHAMNFDELYNVNDPYNLGSQLTLSEEFRVSIRSTEQQSSALMITEYISVFGHSHFLLSDIFKNLKKIVVLDDDVVVQKDLSSLWNLDLQGKVIGAVEFCGVKVGQLSTYLGGNDYDANSCAWMSGLNVIDLDKWRQHNISATYQRLNDKLQSTSEEASWRAAALPASLLVFRNLIHPLDPSWALSGLGHDYGVSTSALKDATVLHYNGNMKPWLDLGIPKYKWHWKKYLTQDERFMDECNVNQ